MDADRFDTLTRSLTDPASRRRALAAAFGGALGLLAWSDAQDAAAKNCKKITDKKKRKKCLAKTKETTRVPPVSPPPPPRPTCTDRVKNGSETGVDCGGPTCPRCADGLGCASRNDCANFVCTSGTCAACGARGTPCGADGDGNCYCEQPAAGGPTGCYQEDDIATNACSACQGNTVCTLGSQPGSFDCRKPCGAS